MTRLSFGILTTMAFGASLGLGLAADSRPAAPTGAPALAVSHQPEATLTLAESQAMVKEYCVTCHSDRAKAGGLSLAAFDATEVVAQAETAEKVIRKLRTGMMPPANARRPAEGVLLTLATTLESHLDRAAAANPNPGWRPFQRLNRAEYQRAVHDLLGIEVDVTAFLPPDTISGGFDNVADAQAFSATLMEGYLRAAARISTLAVGDRHASATEGTYRVARTGSQLAHVPGAPMGTRGGISVVHVFPADGEYSFRMMLHSIPTGQLYGSTSRDEQLEVSINGERVALMDINPRMSESDPQGMNIITPRVFVRAGPQRVSAAFIKKWDAPVDDLIAPIDHTLADSQIGAALGVTTVPHLRDFNINGPFNVTGVSDTPSRRLIFSCRPTSAAEEAPCAAEIVRRLASQAYRGPLSAEDFEGLMGFFERGRADGDFESGVRMAVQAMLASPRFLFRLEPAPTTLRAGQTFRVGDIELASRLSFFLWGTVPDAELVQVAMQGRLRAPGMLERQVRRMLADPRAAALSDRFAAQWLRLHDLPRIHPDALLYPYYDHTLSLAMEEETRLFFGSLVQEDRSIIDLLTADYTFVNERLAKHYGIPNVTGPQFRRVSVPMEERRGILGHGSILTLTSIADRTSPVMRGVWVMEVLLGTHPPAPPPNVPALEEVKSSTRLLSVREKMEEHRANPACTSCHRVIDPLGLALENFDVTGRWRVKDAGMPIDATGELYDGSPLDGPNGLRAALLKRKDVFLLSFTESLMTYALGRRVEYFDLPAVRAIVRGAAGDDYRVSAFILGIVSSDAFQMSRLEEYTDTTARAH
jgi:mono/diheme cytochrome c family protein